MSNVASRLCDEPKPGQILISPRVLTKVENAVKVEPVGEFELKGIRRPLAAYNVLNALSSESHHRRIRDGLQLLDRGQDTIAPVNEAHALVLPSAKFFQENSVRVFTELQLYRRRGVISETMAMTPSIKTSSVSKSEKVTCPKCHAWIRFL